jgi:hypothetical protein
MNRIIWKIPQRWTTATAAQRALLYPGLYINASGGQVDYRRKVASHEFDETDAIVLVVDDVLDDDDLDLMRRAAAATKPVILSAAGDLDREALSTVRSLRAVLAAPSDKGPYRSAFPPNTIARESIPGYAARRAEDALALRALGHVEATSDPQSRRSIVFIADSVDSALEIWPALAPFASGDRELVLACDGADVGRLGALPCRLMPFEADGLLGLVTSAESLLCAFPATGPNSAMPGIWARTALFHGVPVVASSHPSMDGLAHLCVLDDWERGLALYALERNRVRAGYAGHTFLRKAIDPARVVDHWLRAFELAREVSARQPPPKRTKPLLLVLLDLSQDFELLLPILIALRERDSVGLRICVTDWLQTESTRTFEGLAEAEFDVEVVERGAARRGEAPDLTGAAGVLTASDTTAGPHRAANQLSTRAKQAGLPSFTLQHGLENVGLTYRDEVYAGDVDFGAACVFIWGTLDNLPNWVSPQKRDRIASVGSPKKTPPPAQRLRFSEREWRRTVGVFENLHWDRYDEDYRRRFLADLSACAAKHVDTLFVIKPHHAGRWLSKNPGALAATENVLMIDPMDPAWQPYTAPALITSIDRVITTPSTVAVDAVRAGRPVAVAGYGVDLDLYAPLPVLSSSEDWDSFLSEDRMELLTRNEAFLARAIIPGCADHRIAAKIEKTLHASFKTGMAPSRVRAAASQLEKTRRSEPSF